MQKPSSVSWKKVLKAFSTISTQIVLLLKIIVRYTIYCTQKLYTKIRKYFAIISTICYNNILTEITNLKGWKYDRAELFGRNNVTIILV